MLSIYPACFFEEENHYSVIFPDFNYLSTCGDSLQDAMEMAVDCLAGALFSAKLDNEDIPIPSKLEEIDPTQIASELEFEFKQSFVTLVSVDVDINHTRMVKQRSYEQKNQFFASPSRSIDCQIAFVVNYKYLTHYTINPHTFY